MFICLIGNKAIADYQFKKEDFSEVVKNHKISQEFRSNTQEAPSR